MRFLRLITENTNHALGDTLRSIVGELDEMWWYLGGVGLFPPKHALKSSDDFDDWNCDVNKYIICHEHGKVCKPGFFLKFGDCVEFEWSQICAINNESFPDYEINKLTSIVDWCDQLPLDLNNIEIVVRDIDGAIQDYGFKNYRMFEIVRKDFESRGFNFREVDSSNLEIPYTAGVTTPQSGPSTECTGVTTSQSIPSTECHTGLASNHEQNPAGIPPSPSDP